MADKNQKPEHDMQTQILLKEADEALRQEKLELLWKEWGPTIVGIALMVVFGTMLGVGWKSWRASVHSQQTAMLISTQEKGLAVMTDGEDELSGKYAGMAALIYAGDFAAASGSANNPVIASLLHQKMVEADESGLPKRYDILAEWGRLRTEVDANPAADKQEIAANMEKLAAKRGNPYAPMIMVEAAMIYGIAEQNDKALSALDKADNAVAPQENAQIRELINNLKTLYTSDNNRT